MSYEIGKSLAMLHVPKTGGSFIRRTLDLDQFGDVHATEPHPERKTFCCTRDPVTWLPSMWAHCMRHDGYKRNPKFVRFKKTPFADIEKACFHPVTGTAETFVMRYLEHCPGEFSRAMSLYTDACDFTIPQEDLRMALVNVLKWSGELDGPTCRKILETPDNNKAVSPFSECMSLSPRVRQAVWAVESEYCREFVYGVFHA